MGAFEKLMGGQTLTEEEKKELLTLPPEQLEQAKAKLAGEAVAELDKITARRAELKRLDEKKTEEDVSFQKKFRDEQVTKARSRFFAEFPDLSEQQKLAIDTEFARIDDGSLDSDYILRNFKKAYVAIDPEDFISSKKKVGELEAEAQEFLKKQAAPPAGTETQADPNRKYSPEAYEMVKEARGKGMALSLDEAQNSLEKGLKRVYK